MGARACPRAAILAGVVGRGGTEGRGKWGEALEPPGAAQACSFVAGVAFLHVSTLEIEPHDS